jgi:hypothetical protein
MTFPHPAVEEQRKRLYPTSMPSQRPVIDMTQPCWWCPVEAERLVTKDAMDAKWRWHQRLNEVSAALSHWSNGQWRRGPLITPAEAAEMRRVADAAWRVYERFKTSLVDYYEEHGSVCDNGAVRYEWAPGERIKVEL